MAADNVSVIAWPQNVNTPVWPCTEIGFCRSLSDEKLNSGPDSLWSIKSHLRVRVLTPVSSPVCGEQSAQPSCIKGGKFTGSG